MLLEMRRQRGVYATSGCSAQPVESGILDKRCQAGSAGDKRPPFLLSRSINSRVWNMDDETEYWIQPFMVLLYPLYCTVRKYTPPQRQLEEGGKHTLNPQLEGNPQGSSDGEICLVWPVPGGCGKMLINAEELSQWGKILSGGPWTWDPKWRGGHYAASISIIGYVVAGLSVPS